MTDEARARAATLVGRESALERLASEVGELPAFGKALRRKHVSVIAEVKRSSPSRGAINAGLDLESQVVAYERGGAAAISILTEPNRFGGSNQDLSAARKVVAELPLLKKDFHVEPIQLLEAKAIGASAALVIVRALPPAKLRELIGAADSIGLEVLVEVRDEAELDLALSFGAKVVGINNRNLETLEIDPDRSLRLLPLVPIDVIAISESGLASAADVERVAAAGADAVLIGSELSGSREPESAVRALVAVPRVNGARQG